VRGNPCAGLGQKKTVPVNTHAGSLPPPARQVRLVGEAPSTGMSTRLTRQ